MSRVRLRNNESSKLFWCIQNDKVGMINSSTPITVISYIDNVMRRETVELHKSYRHKQWRS